MHLISVVALFLLLQCRLATAEFFTSMSDMEALVDTEDELVKYLDKYILAEETKIQTLRSFLKEYDEKHKEASADVSKYVANPLNAFRLVKRLTADWKHVESVMSQSAVPAVRSVLRLPTDEDLNGAATALMRLQDIYQLDTRTMADGMLQGTKYSSQLTAGDCWELGKQSYSSGDHYHTVLWMSEALRKYGEEKNKTASRQDILDYLAFSTFKQGNVKEALQLTNELLRVAPHHQRAQSNKEYFEDILRNMGMVQSRGENTVYVEPFKEPFSVANLKLHKPVNDAVPDRVMFERLCRGEKWMKPSIEARLRCRYVTNNVPYLFLMPQKMEEAYHNPRIVVYHDVISDREIETVKRLSQPRFKRAVVHNPVTGVLEPATYRVSKTAWIASEEHDDISRVCRRVGDITGLDMDAAEDLQVSNYGIGGHYDPHFDYSRREEPDAFGSRGNRIATWLFYMSDVEAGGGTVFPRINVALWPKKGSAAFWYNLHRNGEGNELTRHAACPVLQGSKWVSNKWIHERKQEFRRPCGLNYDD